MVRGLVSCLWFAYGFGQGVYRVFMFLLLGLWFVYGFGGCL